MKSKERLSWVALQKSDPHQFPFDRTGFPHRADSKELMSAQRKLHFVAGKSSHVGQKNPMFGRKHKESTKEIIREKRKKQVGPLCPGYGKPSKRRKIVYARKKEEKEWEVHESTIAAGKACGLSNSFISNVIAGRKKSREWEFTYRKPTLSGTS